MADPFDPQLPAGPLLGGPVTLSQGTVHQQAAFDDDTGEVYATQVIAGGVQLHDEPAPVPFADRARRGDLAINRVGPGGELLGVMYARRFDHGAGIGVQRVGGEVHLWTGYDAEEAPPGSDGYATCLARFPFRDGTILDLGDPFIAIYDPAPDADHITASVDTAHDQIALRYHRSGDYFLRVHRLSAFTPTGGGEVLHPERQIPVAPQFQSWVIFGDYVYTWHGHAGERLYITIYSLLEGAVIREVTIDQYPDLTYREAESICVKDQASENPLLTWGVATGGSGSRRMNLYAPTPVAPTRIEAEAVPEGVILVADVEAPETVTLWQVIRRPDGAVLFTGDGADLPDPPVQMLDTAPLRCTDLAYDLRVVRGGVEEVVSSGVVQFIPPEGCGGTVGAIGESPDSIGCPARYRVAVHWRGGALQLPLDLAENLVECTWSRTLNDASEATATLSRGLYEDCCHELTKVHPWTHELTVYRELPGELPEIVWQGPILRTRVRRESVLIEAVDVFAWLERLVNTWRMRYVTAEPDDVGRRRGTVVYIAQNVIRLNMVESSLSEPDDYAGLYEYIATRTDGLSAISWRKDGTTTEENAEGDPVVVERARIWRVRVSDILRELAKSGLRWTTVGRTLLLRSQSSALSLPIARLDFADFSGDTEIVRDGAEAATRSFATYQQGEELKGRTVSAGRVVTAYGRLDRLVTVQEDNPSDAQLRRVATNDLAGRYPAPTAISMPGQAQLAPEAAITIRKLVPGERIDVIGDACFQLEQGFLLTDVEGVWDSDAGERISVGLTTLPPYAESGDI